VATCAGGPSAVKYGVTRDYVLGLEAVLPDGSIINTGVQTAKGVVGYDMTRLLVGSEGTLAVITKIILRLLPRPEAKTTFLLFGSSLERTTGFVVEILKQLIPCTLEFMDRTALGIVGSRMPFPPPETAAAMLLIEFDGLPACVQAQAEKLELFAKDYPGILSCQQAADPKDVDRIWSARRALSPAAFELRPHKISEDVVVPRNRIPDLASFAEWLTRELGIIVFTFGHAGDGNIHVNIMLNREDPHEVAQSRLARSRLYDRVLSLGGTISGEHGIGISKANFLPHEIDTNTLHLMKSVKKVFDPKNILNPGKIFPATDIHIKKSAKDIPLM
jgi:glycolate oxidase